MTCCVSTPVGDVLDGLEFKLRIRVERTDPGLINYEVGFLCSPSWDSGQQPACRERQD